MAKVNFTPEQQLVIDKRESNILVSAAAGSGKTEVLTKRIVSLITDEKHPIDIDRMLILTFTKAAAAEMRERISREISSRLLEDPENENLWRQSTLILGAQISTIDSFCLYVIRNNFADIDLDPGFRIMDEGEGKLMLKDAIHAIFERHYDDAEDESFRHLIECYSNIGSDDRLENMIIDMYKFVMSHPDPKEWMESALDAFKVENSEDIVNTKLWKSVEVIRKLYIEQGYGYAKKGLDICGEDDGPAKYTETLQAYFQCFESLLNETGYERCYRLIHNTEFPALSRGKAPGENPDKREEAKGLKEKADECLKKLKKIYVADEKMIVADSRYVLNAARQFMQLLEELIQEFSTVKREKNIVDFTDMEHLALDILLEKDEEGKLHPSKSALEYQDYFEVVMVDEYQDSNQVQEYILKSIARDDNYFMVGDVKQSIYRFRQAQPEIFIGKYNTYENNEAGSINTRIDLNKNFRSRDTVVDFVNYVFESIMHEATSSIDYDDSAKLVAGAVYPEKDDCDSEVIILAPPSDDNPVLFDDDDHAAEALLVANKINEMMASHFQVTDKQTRQLRDMSYRDVVILLRSSDGWADVFTKVLEKQGIPAYSTVKSGYFATTEIKTLLNYLSVIDNPRQDIPFYGVLTSVFGGFSENQVAMIKAYGNEHREDEQVEKCLYDAFILCDDESILEKKKALLDDLSRYRKCAAYMSIHDLIEMIIHETGYIDYMTSFIGGDKRKANIYALLEKAGKFEQTSFHGLFHFVRYISMLKASNVDFGEAGIVDESDDVVRIMTIHASKGLEFPVCFVSGSGKKFNKMDARNTVLYDMTYGIGLDYINPETREKRSTIQKRLLARKIELLGLAEEIRILYVALTRAKEKLIITAEIEDIEKVFSALPEKGSLIDADIITCDTYIEMILKALAQNDLVDRYVSILTKDKLSLGEIEKGMTRKALYDGLLSCDDNVDDAFKELITKRMSPEYMHSQLKGLYSKTTVSELKKAAFEKEDETAHQLFASASRDEYIPTFARTDNLEETIGGALRGTAYHRLMELTDFKSLTKECDKTLFARQMIKDNLENGRLTKDAADMIKISDCAKFYETELAMRMAEADRKGMLYKEKSFFYGMSANRVKPEFPEEELMLVQGVIDVYFQEGESLVVADYKTDKVSTDEELIKRYKTQLDIYAEALSSITGKPVMAKIIYSFAMNKEILL